jgi:hypothetical protein
MSELVNETAQEAPADAAEAPWGTGSGHWSAWLMAVLTTCLVGVPIGVLLCYAALLPFMIGLFFFMLFGVLLGAVTYRVGQRGRPMPRWTVRGAVAVVVVVVLAISLATEGYDFPRQVAKFSYEEARKLPEDKTPDEFLRSAREDVARHLDEHFPPGGVIGYIRWAATSSRIDPPVAHLERRSFVANQRPRWWITRIVLSILLLGYGVNSQVSPLTRLRDAREPTGSAGSPLSKI